VTDDRFGPVRTDKDRIVRLRAALNIAMRRLQECGEESAATHSLLILEMDDEDAAVLSAPKAGIR